MITPPPKYYRKPGGGVGLYKSSQSWVPVVFLCTFVTSSLLWNVLFKRIFETQNPVLFGFITACVVSSIFGFVLLPLYRRKVEKSDRAAANKNLTHDRKIAERVNARKSTKTSEYK